MSTKTTITSIATAGAKLGRDSRPDTVWTFYLKVQSYLGDQAGDTREKTAETLRKAILAKVFPGKARVTAADVKASGIPSAKTIAKRSREAARFAFVSEDDRDIPLEVFITAARGDHHKTDQDAAAAVLALAAKLAPTKADDAYRVTVDDAREAWPSKNGKGGRRKGDKAGKSQPMTIGEMVDYLIGQSAATSAFAAANPEKIDLLLAVLAGDLADVDESAA